MRLANNPVVSRPLAVQLVPPAGRVPPNRSARDPAGNTSSAEVGKVNTMYLVWDATDHSWPVPDDEGNAKLGERTLIIRGDEREACQLAVQLYKEYNASQLVVKLDANGTTNVVSFVGELESKLCKDYGASYSWMSRESQRAVAAAVVLLFTDMRKEKV